MAEERHSGDLLRASRSGDRTALQTLLQQHLPGLRAFARLRMSPLLRARESASDLVQSTCRDVLLALDDFEYRGEEAFRGWLYTAVWNKLRDKEQAIRARKRDARREVALDDGDPDDPGGSMQSPALLYGKLFSPSQMAMADEAARQLEAAFDALPEHYREVVTLSRVAQLTRAEIARRMGRSEGSVRNLLTRALVELAHLLDAAPRDGSQR